MRNRDSHSPTVVQLRERVRVQERESESERERGRARERERDRVNLLGTIPNDGGWTGVSSGMTF